MKKRVTLYYPLFPYFAKLFLGLLEYDVFAELCTVFLEFYLLFDGFLVLAGPINLACRLVFELYKFVL